MTAFLLIVIVLLLFGVLGAVIKGVLWLALIGVAVILAASAFGWFRMKAAN
ncbi:hypothetical protein [Candidatus Neomicrothrix sp.]|uniref:Uncharacterized protein n=1 Tax=Candidatus Neomicrothrix subdominans TaxID=2954438 RepID=A0A936NAE4_9ACTN|nr:hypothetical protein [Candidatus Microthrix sp.]MBK9296041.1 hypothetical protein [Candidatus Microthrix subdominans]MBK6311885.1 hypothetical protein [Candidatus Microthrix sp.]MBK6440363.1 hypothetical protein [Candidatus Microthrix sp.]MBK6968361.1 hypothetical protein [Candidatus Microthrix sp.]MBK7167342.1 hypothetical protein [Candidatus Microthrix sp.]